jgi:hypothetical protein
MDHPNSPNDTSLDEDENDDVTIIYLEEENEANSGNNNSTTTNAENRAVFHWIERVDGSIIYDEHRRAILIEELKRVQRTSCIQFSILCILPAIFFVAMAIAVLGQNEECVSTVTDCELEPRTFVNAFTTRCVCHPIPVDRIPNDFDL